MHETSRPPRLRVAGEPQGGAAALARGKGISERCAAALLARYGDNLDAVEEAVAALKRLDDRLSLRN